MVLEGLAAVGAAAAVAQFVGYGFQVVSKSNELYHSTSGSLQENAFLESVINDFKAMLERIEQSSIPASQAVQGFRDKGLELAIEMLDGLEKLKVKGRPSKWKSLRQALKAVNTKEKVKDWDRRLNTLRDQFNSHVYLDMLEKVTFSEVSMLTEFQQLEVQQQQRLQVFMDALSDLRDVFEADLQQQLREIKDSSRFEHEVTRTQIAAVDRHTHDTIKSEHESTRSLSTKEAEDTRNLVMVEHYETRQHVSARHDELHEAIETGQAQTMMHSEQQHDQTVTTITDSIVEQRISTEQNLKSDNQQRIDYLEAELNRVQLENDSSIRRESERTRQAYKT